MIVTFKTCNILIIINHISAEIIHAANKYILLMWTFGNIIETVLEGEDCKYQKILF